MGVIPICAESDADNDEERKLGKIFENILSKERLKSKIPNTAATLI